MRRFALLATALIAAFAAEAQIYKWQDENNKTVISDRPPAGKVRQQTQIDAEAPAAGSETGKTFADREMEFRKRQKEARESAEKSAKEQRATADRKENCDAARSSLQLMESGERVSMRDSKGERYFLDDAQREREVNKARQIVQATCR
ncbi:DUF4124 domain-containing protein [Candidatus Accumulibacter aalborgensis]|nr:DUF4124 domain-containing protein [Candidatus Accumulibacter aalborgensis]